MKSKFNMYISLFSLTLTTFLLICVICAWYVTNEEATADGMIGMVDSEGIDFIGTKIYYLNSVDAQSKYVSSGAIERSGDNPGITNGEISGDTILRDFDNEDDTATLSVDESITAALVVVEYEIITEDSVSYVVNLETDYNKVITTDDEEQLSLFQDNRLSNVINVFPVNSIKANYTDSDISYYSNIGYDINQSKDFIDDNDNSIKNTSIEIGRINYDATNEASLKNGYFYFIIDYNDSNINYLYDRMLEIFGNKADLTTPILFSTDLYITAT